MTGPTDNLGPGAEVAPQPLVPPTADHDRLDP